MRHVRGRNRDGGVAADRVGEAMDGPRPIRVGAYPKGCLDPTVGDRSLPPSVFVQISWKPRLVREYNGIMRFGNLNAARME